MQTRLLTKLERILNKEPLECYILMICNKSETTDELFVEMSYEGDEALGCYMLENAKSILEQKLEESNTPEDNEPTT